MVGGGEGDRGDTVGKGSGVVDGVAGVHERSSMVDSVVCKRGSVDQGSSVVDAMVGKRSSVVDAMVGKGSSVVDDGLVGAGNSLVLHVSVVLLVLIHKVVNNLSPAVRQVDHILALDNGTLADLCAGVLIGVSVSVNAVHVVAKLVVMGDLLIGGGVDKRSSVVDGVVSNGGSVDKGGSMMDGMVGKRSGVNKGGGVVDGMVRHGGGVDKGSRSIWGSIAIRGYWGVGCSVRHRGDIGSWGVAVSWGLGHGCCHQGR